ncbi:NCS1 family nucleobase:cation symporter-1 [Alcaligenes phenolicus]|uniref:NCS1 family nucleobase:cation symporter-1 n=1 Tax=Alcaligenes phenolicus TaxID=232846 RepID=UPI002AA5E599|nr:NCS1 family nucleobase:cation symporter-1 [Alcaligenes phenolicus]
MEHSDLSLKDPHPALHNEDLAPLPRQKRLWGWFEIFNVWSNDIQSLFGYTLAATLFISYGLNGWAVFAGILLAGFIVMGLVNLSGKPSVLYGVPYPVIARISMGVKGAKFPALVRGIVAIFWYGVQTYFASTALALLFNALLDHPGGALFLGLDWVGWVSYVVVCILQLGIFLMGMKWITRFLNWAGPLVYLVMFALLAVIWYKAGGGLLDKVGEIFAGKGSYEGGPLMAFGAVVGTMVAYFAAVVINYGDFSRFVKDERSMRIGNFMGLPVSLAVFSFLALFITAGTAVLFGETLTNPTDIVDRVDSLALTVIAALTFFAATVGINLVANFIPPAFDLANLKPELISAKMGGILTAVIAFFIGGLWLPLISAIGITGFVDTLGALLAPLYGIMIVDFYLIRKQRVVVSDLFSLAESGTYYFQNGWNKRAMAAFFLAAVFSVATVWVPALANMAGYGWLIGALLGGVFQYVAMRTQVLLKLNGASV